MRLSRLSVLRVLSSFRFTVAMAALKPENVGLVYIRIFLGRCSNPPAKLAFAPISARLSPTLSPNISSLRVANLYGVSLIPNNTVPQLSLFKPAKVLRLAKVFFAASSKLICCSTCQIADKPSPISSVPLKPNLETLLDTTRFLTPVTAVAPLAVVVPLPVLTMS